jgi:hypothetical protein
LPSRSRCILRLRSGFDIRLDEEIGDASDGGPETVDRLLGCVAQQGFELGEGVLDRIEIADGNEGWRLPIGSSRALSGGGRLKARRGAVRPMGGDRRSERIQARKNTILAIREAKSDIAVEE